MLDRHREARDILCRYLRGKQAWTDSDFVALFSTARNLAEFEDVRAFLAPAALAGKSRLGLLQKYSMALLQLGDTAKALEIARTRFLEATAFPEPQRPLRAPADGWSLGAEQALLDLKTDMDLGGFEFFLISGTLLGCIREGKLLKHDKDIDVGVPADTSVDQLRAHLQSTGRFRVKPVENDRVLRALHCNGTSVDLFWHWDEGDKIMHQGSMSKWWNTPFSLASHAFLGTGFCWCRRMRLSIWRKITATGERR